MSRENLLFQEHSGTWIKKKSLNFFYKVLNAKMDQDLPNQNSGEHSNFLNQWQTVQ